MKRYTTHALCPQPKTCTYGLICAVCNSVPSELVLLWCPLGPLSGLAWFPLASYGILWPPMASYGFLWLPVASYGFLRLPENLRTHRHPPSRTSAHSPPSPTPPETSEPLIRSRAVHPSEPSVPRAERLRVIRPLGSPPPEETAPAVRSPNLADILCTSCQAQPADRLY